MEKTFLYGQTLEKLRQIVKNNNMPQYTSMQIANWLYKKHIRSIEDMTDISLRNREKLMQSCEVGKTQHLKSVESKDGTIKYLYSFGEGKYVESVLIPDKERATVCVSSQIGCKMGCKFCMTGKQGFQGNLTTNQILTQIGNIISEKKVTNIVYMGMGEPFDNIDNVLESLEILTSNYGYGFSPTRITVSTVGIIPGIERFLKESKCHLAISLHSPFDDERKDLVPVQIKYPVKEVLRTIRTYNFGLQRRISFEYIVFKDINDSVMHLNELARLLSGIRCRVNLIRFHKIPGSSFFSPDEKELIAFRDNLNKKGIITTIRASRGEDIEAACGLLSTKELNRTK